MSDWLHNLPEPWMALVTFGFTCVLAAAISAIAMIAMATGDAFGGHSYGPASTNSTSTQ
jgi:hypothetical protein